MKWINDRKIWVTTLLAILVLPQDMFKKVRSLSLIPILGIMLITLLSTGYSPDPEPEPVDRRFARAFDHKRTRADRYFNNFEYKSAIKLYSKLVKKGKADDGVKLRLAESYQKINDPVNAEKWYSEVMHTNVITPQDQIQYAQTLMRNGKYREARKVLDSYEFADSDYRSKAIINTLDKLEIFYADSMFYELSSIEDNKPQYSDFSPTVYKKGIVFVSSRHDKGPKFKWDDTPFLDLYYTETDVASAKPFSEALNSKYHEGPIAFYNDYSKAVFTRSNYLDRKLGATEDGINNLQLYTTSWDNDKNDWGNIKPINFLINNYSYGHPAISVDNSRLYFISDMPGGFGGTDIYVSERIEEGWGEPKNMGDIINTPGNEMFPFIDDESNLYFASNGHGGLGGLDVYQINLDGNMDLRNMGYPLNTTADDFGFSLTSSGEIAYVSSNREGPDNIFHINIKAPNLEMILADNSVNGEAPDLTDHIETLATLELSTPGENELLEDASDLSTINASIIDENNEILDNANLKLLVDGQELEDLISNDNGKVSIQVPSDQEYTLIASKAGFEDRVISIPAETLGQEEDVLIVMNSTFIDSDLSPNEDQIPTTELEPLAVTDEGWDDSNLESKNSPEINGVALAALPEISDNSTTELDPLAMHGYNLDDSYLEGNEPPELNGVALADLPKNSGASTENSSTTGIDPLVTNQESWNESKLGNNTDSKISEVALAENSWEPANLSGEISDNVDKQLVEAKVFDANSNAILEDAEIKFFVDNPNQELNYEINDGILTFEARPDEDYIIVATHDDYQDEYIKLTGEELLADNQKDIRLELGLNDGNSQDDNYKGPSTKFKTKVTDEATNQLLDDAEVRFFVDGKAIESETTKDNGKTVFKSSPGKDYMMLVSRKGYQDLVYNLPGLPEDDMDVDLAMLNADHFGPSALYRQLAVKGYAHDENTGDDLADIVFKVFENGDLIETTDDLTLIEADPQKHYQILASKEGYNEDLITIKPEDFNKEGLLDLPFTMKPEHISEATGVPVYEGEPGSGIPVSAHIIDITNDQPLSEAVVIVFADDAIQEQGTTWTTGIVTINAVPGKDYQLVVKRDGYSDKIINIGEITSELAEGLEIAMIPEDIQKIRQSDIDLTEANMLVMSGPSGEDQLYLSTDKDLFKYVIENENHYLVNDSQKLLLKERSRSSSSKVTDKQNTDQFNLRSEDQFLYDQLNGDEKTMVDKIVDKINEESLEDNQELVIYYNNLPEEYRALVDNLATIKKLERQILYGQEILASSGRLGEVLSENNIALIGTFNVNNIYYDFDKATIREDAAIELDKLALILKSNKNIRVEMFSHTDSRGSNNYNSALSNRRGSAAVNYLVEKGVSLKRFATEGRGESQLVNSCQDSIECSEQAHQLNRRTEFILSA